MTGLSGQTGPNVSKQIEHCSLPVVNRSPSARLPSVVLVELGKFKCTVFPHIVSAFESCGMTNAKILGLSASLLS